MAISARFREFVAEQLAGVGAVTIRSMFGGAGVYSGGVMFGLIAEETLYLKADNATKGEFEAEGSGPFVYETKSGGNMIMSYWRVPERLYDDADDMLVFARKALAVARSAQAKKPPRKAPAKRKRF